MSNTIKSKKQLIQISKKRVVFQINQGELKPISSKPHFSSVVVDDSLEGHVFMDATTLSGIHDFTLCHMNIPSAFKFVPYDIDINNVLTLGNPIQLVNEDMCTLVLLNLGTAIQTGHLCADIATGNRVDHGSAFCSILGRATNQDDIMLFKYSGKLKFPKVIAGSLEVATIDGEYYLIPMMLSDRSIIYNAVLLRDNANQVEIISDAAFKEKLKSWLILLKSDPDFWTRIGVDEPIFPIWDDGLEIYIASGMFVADKGNPVTKHKLI